MKRALQYWDRRTERWKDGWTDRRTNKGVYRAACLTTGKNITKCFIHQDVLGNAGDWIFYSPHFLVTQGHPAYGVVKA